MPNLANAKKALRQSKRRYERNKLHRAELHSIRRQIKKLCGQGKKQEAQKMISGLYKLADKMAARGIMKKNRASRIKARAIKLTK